MVELNTLKMDSLCWILSDTLSKLSSKTWSPRIDCKLSLSTILLKSTWNYKIWMIVASNRHMLVLKECILVVELICKRLSIFP
jgi:hypothetical protein